ncbi:uncharacterized protein ARMOST_08292 [Armillaria ostoyae]|uniref:F-box domain-containing protein n=1 Tax=Armillaria ostoyae TaxID=47428 RepID=A0A284R875_ARMOS|nr:uncharacterized protein ARMOST_08292 [Armillaria ostoyae]
MGELRTLDINDTAPANERSYYTYDNTVLTAFAFTLSISALSVAAVPLKSLVFSPSVFRSLQFFVVHLHGQQAAVLHAIMRMESIETLDTSCDANIIDYNAVIKLPSLSHLILREIGTSGLIKSVWSRFRTDRLDSLRLYYEGGAIPPVWPHFSEPHRALTCLCISYADSVSHFDRYDGESTAMLASLPNIENLHLTVPHICNRLFEELRTNSKFLSRLSTLAFLCWDLQEEEDIAVLASVLHTQHDALKSTSIRTLVLHRSDPLSVVHPVTPGWEDLLEAGLTVNFQ